MLENNKTEILRDPDFHWKANTNLLNYGVWQTKYTRTKKFRMFVLK